MTFLGARKSAEIALIAEDGGRLTYGNLEAEVERFASALQDRGVIFCLSNNEIPSLLCYLASVESSVVPLLLPGKISKGQLSGLLAAYHPQYLFHNRGDLADIAGDVILSHGDYALYRLAAGFDYALHPDLALLLTTSGSTGSRKLVRLSKRNLVSNADAIIDYLAIGESERAITTLPMHYSYGLSVINSHLRAGATVVLTDRSILERGFWELLRREEATSFAGVPYTYEMLLKLGIERLKMPSVKTLTQAGGRLAPEKIRRVAEVCAGKGIRFFPMYGQTEATARIAYLPWQDVLDKAGSIGRPIPGGTLWLEDAEGIRITSPGCPGELIYAGQNVCLGYATSCHDLAAGDHNHGRLRTGDLAVMDDDGGFSLVGRLSRFVKVFGNRISLDEIEAILSELKLNSAVIGSDDHIHVYLEGDASAIDVRSQLASTLAINSSAISTQCIQVLPRLENGKIDYLSLSALSTDACSDAH